MSIAVFEAKSKLSTLLDRVCSGEEVVITRHGTPIARLVPMDARAAPDRARAVRARAGGEQALEYRCRRFTAQAGRRGPGLMAFVADDSVVLA